MNEYLDGLTREKFTAKDFRTWKGTTEMILALRALGPAGNASEAKKKITEAVKLTAQKLGNRPAACRAYYIHPAIPEAFIDGVHLQGTHEVLGVTYFGKPFLLAGSKLATYTHADLIYGVELENGHLGPLLPGHNVCDRKTGKIVLSVPKNG